MDPSCSGDLTKNQVRIPQEVPVRIENRSRNSHAERSYGCQVEPWAGLVDFMVRCPENLGLHLITTRSRVFW